RAAQVPDAAFGGTSRNRRPCLLPRKIRGRGRRDRRNPREHGEDAVVLRAQETCRSAEGSRHRTGLAMTAANKKIAEDTPGDIEALLPWHAAGTLNARDTR